jgi:type I restriction enzyme M protein
MSRNKNPGRGWRDRRGEVLFVDARKLGFLVDRTRKEFSDADIASIATTYHAWRGEKDANPYADVPGFCRGAKLEEIRSHSHVLTPGRYVGAADVEDDDVPFAERFAALKAKLEGQLRETENLSLAIRSKLGGVLIDG